MSEWEHGDVAMVECSDGEYRPALLDVDGWSGSGRQGRWVFANGGFRWVAESFARPAALVDFEDATEVERLLSLYYNHPGDYGVAPRSVTKMQAALREFAKPRPPKPEEPTGLGAVVRDRIGHTWTRTHRPSSVIEGGRKPWTAEIDTGFDSDYADIDVVKVLDEGWPE